MPPSDHCRSNGEWNVPLVTIVLSLILYRTIPTRFKVAGMILAVLVF